MRAGEEVLAALQRGRVPEGEHLPERHAEGPDVALVAVGAVGEALQRLPPHRDVGRAVHHVAVVGRHPRQPEVRDLDVLLVGHEDVARREVAVDDLVLGEVLHPVRDVLRVAEQLLGVVDVVPVDLQVPVQAALADELHDDDGVVVAGDHAADLDDVVVGEVLHQPHLPVHVVMGLGRHGVRVLDLLDGHLLPVPVRLVPHSLVHHAEVSLAQGEFFVVVHAGVVQVVDGAHAVDVAAGVEAGLARHHGPVRPEDGVGAAASRRQQRGRGPELGAAEVVVVQQLPGHVREHGHQPARGGGRRGQRVHAEAAVGAVAHGAAVQGARAQRGGRGRGRVYRDVLGHAPRVEHLEQQLVDVPHEELRVLPGAGVRLPAAADDVGHLRQLAAGQQLRRLQPVTVEVLVRGLYPGHARQRRLAEAEELPERGAE